MYVHRNISFDKLLEYLPESFEDKMRMKFVNIDHVDTYVNMYYVRSTIYLFRWFYDVKEVEKGIGNIKRKELDRTRPRSSFFSRKWVSLSISSGFYVTADKILKSTFIWSEVCF